MTDAPSPRDVIARTLVISFGDREGEVVTDDILSALSAAGYVVEQGWQPIASAPRDGTWVLVWAAMPDHLQWADPDKQLRPVVRVTAWHPDAGWCVDELREAVFWRPLPAAPIAATIRAIPNA